MSRPFYPDRYFLHIPGPTNTPDRDLRATAAPTSDRRVAAFGALAKKVFAGLQRVIWTSGRDAMDAILDVGMVGGGPAVIVTAYPCHNHGLCRGED